jgi:hypothetical protein
MKNLAEQLSGSPKLFLFVLTFVLSQQPSCAQSQQVSGKNWANSPPGTFLQQPGGDSGQLGQSQWQQPGGNSGQMGQSQWQQPASNSGQMGQWQWQQPESNSGQSQWQQPAANQTQWQQPGGNLNQSDQIQWQQPVGNGQPGQSQWQQPAGSQPQWQQPASSADQVGQSQWQQPATTSEQPGLSEGQQPSTQTMSGVSNQSATGPFKSNGQMSRPPLLGEVMQQEQMNSPASETMSLDQSSSLNGAAADALNAPIGNMAAGALNSMGFGSTPGQQLTPQQMQQMIPGVLNFLNNVMPPPGSTMNGPPPPGYGGFPHFATGRTVRRNNNQPPISPAMRRVINGVLRGGRMPGMNQFHF